MHGEKNTQTHPRISAVQLLNKTPSSPASSSRKEAKNVMSTFQARSSSRELFFAQRNSKARLISEASPFAKSLIFQNARSETTPISQEPPLQNPQNSYTHRLEPEHNSTTPNSEAPAISRNANSDTTRHFSGRNLAGMLFFQTLSLAARALLTAPNSAKSHNSHASQCLVIATSHRKTRKTRQHPQELSTP